MNNEENISEQISFEMLPTGKPHVSFSEYRDWKECSYRHYLKNVKGLSKEERSLTMDYGTAVHAIAENFLKTKVIDVNIGKLLLTELYEKSCTDPIFSKNYDKKYYDELFSSLDEIFTGFEDYMNINFPNWETVEAEHRLYENVTDDYPHAFKGFIDCVIKVPHKKSFKYWVIDWKTTTWGWSNDKKNDELSKQQLILYRNFWAKKSNIDVKDVKCAFSLFKRTAKTKHELVKVSVGEITTDRALKNIRNMFLSVKKGIKIKNRDSCKYCPFKDTEHCK